MTEFNQKVAVVTGAASGLGAAVCEALLAAQAEVIAVDIASSLPASFANDVSAYCQLDVSDWAGWDAVATRVSEAGGLDFLHLNAGIQIAPPDAPLDDYQFSRMNAENYRRMMGVNVDGVVFGLSKLLPHMQTGGSIVVTSSLAGITPYAVDPLYSMSKHAVSGLVRSLAQECAAAQLTINAICPGGIDTNIIPQAQRQDDAQFMTPAHVASEVMQLFGTAETGKTWAKVSTQKPAWIVRAPGDRAK